MDRYGNPDGTSAKERTIARKLARRAKSVDHGINRPSSGNRDLLARLAARDGYLCGICGKPLGNLNLCNVDHVVPLSRGGRHVWSNFQPAHITCNSKKANRVQHEFGRS